MMANPRILPPRRLAAALLSLGLVAGWHVSAAAQQVVARINGDPITAIDIAQRSKLIQVSALKNIATRAGSTPDNFAKALNGQGISVEAVKTRIKADMGWSQIIRGKFQSTFQIREKEILDTLQSNRKEDQPAVGYEYTLRPILLIIPRGSSEEVIAARKREAEGLRSRFQNCDEGLR